MDACFLVFVFSVLSKATGWEERPQNVLFCLVGHKTLINHWSNSCWSLLDELSVTINIAVFYDEFYGNGSDNISFHLLWNWRCCLWQKKMCLCPLP